MCRSALMGSTSNVSTVRSTNDSELPAERTRAAVHASRAEGHGRSGADRAHSSRLQAAKPFTTNAAYEGEPSVVNRWKHQLRAVGLSLRRARGAAVLSRITSLVGSTISCA